MVEAFSGPVHLLGHSYGAILALEAAVSTNNLRTLTLFEPPVGWGGLTPLLTRIDVLLDEGDRAAATARDSWPTRRRARRAPNGSRGVAAHGRLRPYVHARGPLRRRVQF